MRKLIYQPLTDFLGQQFDSIVSVSFSRIEEILGRKLPPTAYENPTWWTNNPTGHSQAKAWLAAGFRAEPVVTDGKMVVFKRPVRHQSSGMGEDAVEFKPAQASDEPRQNRHPALGALKGTFTIEPGYDLTKPTMSEEDLAEMFANIERTADLIEAGLRKK